MVEVSSVIFVVGRQESCGQIGGLNARDGVRRRDVVVGWSSCDGGNFLWWRRIT